MRLALIDFQSNRRGALKQAFTAGGFDASSWADSHENLLDFMQRVKPEAIVVDVKSPSRDIVEQLSFLNRNTPKPTVMLTEQHNSEAAQMAVNAGIGVYVVDEVPAELARSLVHVAIANFNSTKALRDELSKAHQELESRKTIAQATSLLIEHAGMSEQSAYEHIRMKAMRDRVTKASVANDIMKLVNTRSSQRA